MKHYYRLVEKRRTVFLPGSIITLLLLVPALIATFAGCEELDDSLSVHEVELSALPLDDVALLLSGIPLGPEQIREVHDAVSASSANGYDEEYMMRHLFSEPGSGVGDDRVPDRVMRMRQNEKALSRGGGSGYSEPIRELIEKYLRGESSVKMKSGISVNADDILGEMTVEEYMEALQSSDVQIYWPYSEKWDGEAYPVITFDPMDGGSVNEGYSVGLNEAGELVMEKVLVNEGVAQERPVWVVNRNDDSEYTSLELLRMEDPGWGSGGGEIIVRPQSDALLPYGVSKSTAQGEQMTSQMLVLKDFTMKRHFDSWFAGASEFFVKIGSVENFTASTEAELQLYTPTVTDFMIVVKRKNIGRPQPFNAVLVSDWTEQLTHCAFMVIEDDGGKRDSWKCSAMVKYNSKSYGFEMSIPINTRDDIVWRGQLSRKYIIANNGFPSHFGDVDITFEIIDM